MTRSEEAARGAVLGPRRLHGISPVLGLFPMWQQLFGPLVVGIVALGRWGLLGAAVVTAFGLGWRILAWSRHTYRVESGVLRVDSGVLNRTTREIPLRRIQQVDLRRQLRHRVFGVVAVRIDTAGGGSGAEAVLDALSDAHALELRSALLTHGPAPAVHAGEASHAEPVDDPGTWGFDPMSGPDRPSVSGQVGETDGRPPPGRASDLELPANPVGAGTTAPPGTPCSAGSPDPTGRLGRQGDHLPAPLVHAPEVVAQVSTRDLAIAGVTGTGLLAGLSIVGFAFLFLDLLPEGAGEQVSSGVADLLSRVLVVGVVVVLIVPVWLAVAAGSSILRDHEFTLVRYGPDLHLRRGLLDQREATLALHRIQAVRLVDNPLRRWFGITAVRLQSAASGRQADDAVSLVTIPLVRDGDLDRVLQMVLPADGPVPDLIPAPPAARRRARVRALLVAAVVVGVVAAVVRSPVALVAILGLVPAWFYAERSYGALGHARTEVTVVSRWGAVIRSTAIVPVAKTQSCQLVSTPFQRRVDLATLKIQVAGNGSAVEIRDGGAARLGALRHGVLAAPGARRDEAAVRRRTHADLETSEASPAPEAWDLGPVERTGPAVATPEPGAVEVRPGLPEGDGPTSNYRADL